MLKFISGKIFGPGKISVEEEGEFEIATGTVPGIKTLDALQVDVAGNMNLVYDPGETFNTINACNFVIKKGGQFQFGDNQTMGYGGSGGRATFSNSGLVFKSSGALTSTLNCFAFDNINGTINSAAPGGTILIDNSGGGTFAAISGSDLSGTYVLDGHIEIASNATDITKIKGSVDVLGATSMFKKNGGANALTLLNTVDANASLTLLNGNFSLNSALTNKGALYIGAAATLSLASDLDYVQSDAAAKTLLDGGAITLAGGGEVDISNGEFIGAGTVTGSFRLTGGTLVPATGTDLTGTLALSGAYTQTGGTLIINAEDDVGGTFSKITCNSATVTTVSSSKLKYVPVNGFSIRNGIDTALDVIVAAVGSSYTFGLFLGTDCALTNLNPITSGNKFQLDPVDKANIRQWNGSVDNVWTNPSNWNSGVPILNEHIEILAGPFGPVIAADVTAGDFVIQNTAVVKINSGTKLVIKGHAEAYGAAPFDLSGMGTIEVFPDIPSGFTADTYRMKGTFVGTTTKRDVTIFDVTTFKGPLTVDTGDFKMEKSVFINNMNDFSVVNNGTFSMEPNVLLEVNGDAIIGGLPTTGKLKATSTLAVSGNFSTHNTNAYAPDPGHLTRFESAPGQTVDLNDPNFGYFQDIRIDKTGGTLTFIDTDVLIKGNVDIFNSIVNGSVTATVRGDILDNAAGSWRVANTTIEGDGFKTLAPTLQTNLKITADVTPLLSTTITGNLVVDGLGAKLNVGRSNLTVSGNFTVGNSAILTMVTGDAHVFVSGSATIGGGSTAGKLIAGGFEVAGNMTVTGANDTYAPSFFHATVFLGGNNQQLQFATPSLQKFNYMKAVKTPGTTLTCASAVQVIRDAYISGAGLNPSGVFDVSGNMEMSNGKLIINISGTTAMSQFDQVNVAGGLKFTGTNTLDVTLAPGYVPVFGDKFKIIQFAIRSGTFATITGLTFGADGVLTATYNALVDLTLEVTAPVPPPLPPPSPPVITLMASSKPIEFVNTVVTFKGAATQAEGHPIVLTWNFGDATEGATGTEVTHTYTSAAEWSVTLTATSVGQTATQTRIQKIVAPSSTGAGTPNVSQEKPPHVNELSGIIIDVIRSDGGIVELSIDPTGLISRESFDDSFDIATRFTNSKGKNLNAGGTEQEDAAATTGSRPVQQFTGAGIYVGTTDVSEKVNPAKKGKGRKTVIVSRREVGGTADKPVQSTTPPADSSVNVTRASGKFALPVDGSSSTSNASTAAGSRAKKERPDLVSITGTVTLAEGIDLSQPFELSVAIGNIIDTVTIEPKGRAAKATASGENERIKKVRVKLPRRKKDEDPLTRAGEKATIDITLQMVGMSEAGFDTEGVSRSVDDGEISVQVGILMMGEAYETDLTVQFKKAKNEESGAISTRASN